MQPNVYKIEEDKLPIKYILGIEQDFPDFPELLVTPLTIIHAKKHMNTEK